MTDLSDTTQKIINHYDLIFAALRKIEQKENDEMIHLETIFKTIQLQKNKADMRLVESLLAPFIQKSFNGQPVLALEEVLSHFRD